MVLLRQPLVIGLAFGGTEKADLDRIEGTVRDD